MPKEVGEERRLFHLYGVGYFCWVQYQLHWFKLTEFPWACLECMEERENGLQCDLQGLGRNFSPLHLQIPLISYRAQDHLHWDLHFSTAFAASAYFCFPISRSQDTTWGCKETVKSSANLSLAGWRKKQEEIILSYSFQCYFTLISSMVCSFYFCG